MAEHRTSSRETSAGVRAIPILLKDCRAKVLGYPRFRRREMCHGYRITPGLSRRRDAVALSAVLRTDHWSERPDSDRPDRLRAPSLRSPADAQDVRRDRSQ